MMQSASHSRRHVVWKALIWLLVLVGPVAIAAYGYIHRDWLRLWYHARRANILYEEESIRAVLAADDPAFLQAIAPALRKTRYFRSKAIRGKGGDITVERAAALMPLGKEAVPVLLDGIVMGYTSPLLSMVDEIDPQGEALLEWCERTDDFWLTSSDGQRDLLLGMLAADHSRGLRCALSALEKTSGDVERANIVGGFLYNHQVEAVQFHDLVAGLFPPAGLESGNSSSQLADRVRTAVADPDWRKGYAWLGPRPVDADGQAVFASGVLWKAWCRYRYLDPPPAGHGENDIGYRWGFRQEYFGQHMPLWAMIPVDCPTRAEVYILYRREPGYIQRMPGALTSPGSLSVRAFRVSAGAGRQPVLTPKKTFSAQATFSFKGEIVLNPGKRHRILLRPLSSGASD